jgi:hypothetical protein
MNLEHEYAILGGFNRASIGRWLYTLAAAISALIVFVVLGVVDLANHLGINATLPPSVLSLFGAASVYAGLYWIFNAYGWKVGVVRRLLKLPNLSGKWHCTGLTLEPTPHREWFGTVTIVQSWDKFRLHLSTQTSRSDSLAAALLFDSAAGYRLMYHYQNAPKLGERDLPPHHGFAELTFSQDEQSAEGEYFNGRGRTTWGKLSLKREVS